MKTGTSSPSPLSLPNSDDMHHALDDDLQMQGLCSCAGGLVEVTCVSEAGTHSFDKVMRHWTMLFFFSNYESASNFQFMTLGFCQTYQVHTALPPGRVEVVGGRDEHNSEGDEGEVVVQVQEEQWAHHQLVRALQHAPVQDQIDLVTIRLAMCHHRLRQKHPHFAKNKREELATINK